MSRGHGYLQRALFEAVAHNDKPITFSEIRRIVLRDGFDEHDPKAKLNPVFERSLRRSLKALTDDSTIMALGEGGPGDPKRYWLNPLLVGMSGNKEWYRKTQTAIEADPGGALACAKLMQKMQK
jgi:hypothetical protein